MLFKAVAFVDYNVATVVVIAVYDGINNTIGYNSTYIINSYQKYSSFVAITGWMTRRQQHYSAVLAINYFDP